jgi:hypothetical protein
MLNVNTNTFTITWNETISSDVINNIWTYRGVERSDDYDFSSAINRKVYSGYDSEAVFMSQGVSNTL